MTCLTVAVLTVTVFSKYLSVFARKEGKRVLPVKLERKKNTVHEIIHDHKSEVMPVIATDSNGLYKKV